MNDFFKRENLSYASAQWCNSSHQDGPGPKPGASSVWSLPVLDRPPTFHRHATEGEKRATVVHGLGGYTHAHTSYNEAAVRGLWMAGWSGLSDGEGNANRLLKIKEMSHFCWLMVTGKNNHCLQTGSLITKQQKVAQNWNNITMSFSDTSGTQDPFYVTVVITRSLWFVWLYKWIFVAQCQSASHRKWNNVNTVSVGNKKHYIIHCIAEVISSSSLMSNYNSKLSPQVPTVGPAITTNPAVRVQKCRDSSACVHHSGVFIICYEIFKTVSCTF